MSDLRIDSSGQVFWNNGPIRTEDLQKLMDDGTYMKILKHWGVESGAVDKAEINPTDLG